MIIFNTTFHVDDDIKDAYLRFMKEIYVPRAQTSGFLHAPCFSRIHHQHEEGGTSFSLQFKIKNVETLNHWLSADGQELQKELTAKFGNKALGFMTLLEEIEL
ncbi:MULTISPECIES: DUF4286 family protein [unclassified Dysgonomonas]|uniref:DUF4286 family protein n=1 Tax=unclassified Dysgonomonas TaxID=2630389 RepID=UPI0013EDE500|nr:MULTISPECIES: DUF4286 family protein [unclassified Dysgonomonas]